MITVLYIDYDQIPGYINKVVAYGWYPTSPLGEVDSQMVSALASKLRGALVQYPSSPANFSQLTQLEGMDTLL